MRRWLIPLILVALTALGARPFWSAEFLSSYDGPLHLFRLFALDLTLKQGLVYPRTILDLAFGYGYPIFNFYPPFAAYAGETLHLLGLNFAQAIQVEFTLGVGAALWGAYVLGMELFSGENHAPGSLVERAPVQESTGPRLGGVEGARIAGLLTAVAYVFFPYFMVGLYSRGALAETLALSILPWLIWSLRRTLKYQTFAPALTAALCLALLFLTHSMTAVIVSPLLVAYTLFELFHLEEEFRLKALCFAALTALLGMGLAAFYWLPFIAELPLVRMGQEMEILSDIFETNFLKPEALIQPSVLYEYGGPPVPLGLAVMTLGALTWLGALAAGARLRPRGTIRFFGAVAGLAALSITEPVRELWLASPLSSMIQSVWRVELLIELGLAIVIGSLPFVLSAVMPWDKFTLRRAGNPRPRRSFEMTLLPVVAGVVALFLIWTSTANLAPSEILLPNDVFNLAHLARFEISGASPGTTTFGEYMPATATASDLVNYHAPSENRTNASEPDIRLGEQRGALWKFQVSTAAPVSIPLRVFYFPDWQVTVDGQPARAYSSTELGLLTVDVPVGNHEVRFYTEDTSIRQVGNAISVVSAIMLLGLLALAIWRHESGIWVPVLTGMVPLAVLGLPVLAALTAPVLPLQTIHLDLSPGFNLIGLKVDDARFEDGTWRVADARDGLHLRVYWQVKRSGLADNPITWRLVDDEGKVWAQRAQRPRYGTTSQGTWVANEIVEDDYDLPLSAVIPPGRYMIQTSPGPNQAFTTAGLMELEKGGSPAAAPDLKFANPVNARLGDRIRLLGYTAAPIAQPGQSYPIILSWQAERDIFEDYTVSVQLLNAGGKLVAQHDSITGEGLNPTSLWIPGQATRERRQVDIPRDLQPGTYTLLALMYRLSDMKRLAVVTPAGPAPDNTVVLGQVQISGRADNIFARMGLPFSPTR